MVLCTLDCCLVLLESEMDRICVRWSMLQERLSCVDSPLPYRFANLQEDKQERLAWMGARRSHDYQALCLLDACYVVDGGREFLCKHWDDLHEALAGNCEG